MRIRLREVRSRTVEMVSVSRENCVRKQQSELMIVASRRAGSRIVRSRKKSSQRESNRVASRGEVKASQFE